MQFGDSQYGLSKLVHSTLIVSFLSACCMCQEGPAVNIVPRANESSAKRLASMRLDVKMVLVPANVTDRNDKPVLNLRKEDFHLFEDSVEQKVESFFVDQGPISLGIVFDASGSMRNKIDKSLSAVDQFLKASLPGDEFLLVQFSDVPTLRLPFYPRSESNPGQLAHGAAARVDRHAGRDLSGSQSHEIRQERPQGAPDPL